MKQLYKIKVKTKTDEWEVEGHASSPNNACRLAFRKLIEAGLIKNTPKSDIDSPTGFAGTTVEVINDF